MLRILTVLTCLALPLGAHSQPAETGGHDLGISAALDHVREGAWLDAVDAGARTGPVGEDIIQWLRLRQGLGDGELALDFVARRSDWPGLARLRARTEEFLPLVPRSTAEAELIVAFFEGGEPVSGQGVVSLVEAYRALGRDGDAQAQAALSWVERSMTDAAEDRLLELYPDELRALDPVRADAMFWEGASNALSRAAERTSGEAATLMRARISALRGNAVASIREDMPASLRDDPGLAWREFEAFEAAGSRSRALAILKEHSVSAEALGRPDAWGRERRDLARELMREGEVDEAYLVASTNRMEEGSDYADLEWVAGFLALRFLDRPEDALRHFRRFGEAVFTPISLGRAGYWIGRAHEALDQPEEAGAAYAEGARWQTSFYGLLAAEKAGLPLDPALAGDQAFPPIADTSFAGSSVLEAALLLQAAGERDLAEVFFTHLSEGLSQEEAGALAQLVLDLGEPHIALRIAKRVAEEGVVIHGAYYPLVDLGLAENPVSDELALSIARRESEFNPVVSSGVGAGGLMQLMPGTAQDVTRELGIAYSRELLFSDPSYNARLGTAYLAGLERRFGENVVLVSSGYNAGPGRPLNWMDDRGDPRTDAVDVIDWIELIPFSETRNYVMRVAESLPVYRMRLGGEGGPVTLGQELKAR